MLMLNTSELLDGMRKELGEGAGEACAKALIILSVLKDDEHNTSLECKKTIATFRSSERLLHLCSLVIDSVDLRWKRSQFVAYHAAKALLQAKRVDLLTFRNVKRLEQALEAPGWSKEEYGACHSILSSIRENELAPKLFA